MNPIADLVARRKSIVAATMEQIKALIHKSGVNRSALDEVKDLLAQLAAEDALFADSEFPTPTPEQVAKIYLLTDDQGGEFSLYLISVLPVGPSPVHDHGTFAVIAGLDGEEENTLYKRLDDATDANKAELVEDAKVVLKKGDAIAFMPQDIHRICVVSDRPTRHFHLYGKGFEQQTDRLEFDLQAGTAKLAGGSFIPVDDSRRVL
jgi:predicted metal-dependent enzyme (double-stranded beta helix superfamily)